MTDREVVPGCARVRTKCKKRLVLVCEDSLCPRKQSDVSGPDLGKAGRYTLEATWTTDRGDGKAIVRCLELVARIRCLEKDWEQRARRG